jgi:hypothetical protein
MDPLRSIARRMRPLRAMLDDLRAAPRAKAMVEAQLPAAETANRNTIELNLIDRPLRLYVVGDSHCLPLRDLIVSDSFTERTYMVFSKYVVGQTASDMSKGGKVSREFLAAIESEEILRDGHFTFSSLQKNDLAVSFAAGEAALAPLLVISAGDIDLRAGLLPKLSDRYDILLPFKTPYGARKDSQIMPYAVVSKIARAALQPLGDAVEHLTQMGLSRALVLPIVPPTVDQRRFEALHGFACPVETRYKATVAFNRTLAEICAASGATFLDIWPEYLDENGYLRPEFELDGVHLNRSASMITVRRIIEAALGKPFSVNNRRYELAHRLVDTTDVEAASTEFEALAKTFHQTGICRLQLPTATAEALKVQMNFSQDVGNRHARMDWVGNTVKPFSDQMLASEPTQESLDVLYQTLYGPRVAPLMQRCMGGDVWYVNCRPLKSLPHTGEGSGPQAFHTDGAPPHVLRALLYLVDVDDENGPFEYVGPSGNPERVIGPKGTFFIFDANRLLHHAVPPRSRLRESIDFVILPRTKSQPRIVLWAGLNNWPSDPFHFSVNNMRASPPLTGKFIETNPATG